MLSRRDYRTTGAVLSYRIGSPEPVPLVLMKPWQIVRGFTYRGAVLDEVRWPVQGNEAPAGWARLRALVRAQEPLLSAPQAMSSSLCAVCRGPCGRRSARCYQCDLHLQCAPGSLADLVVPVAFAIKGSSHARCLWQYKSVRLTAETVERAALTARALLLVFLHDHGPCLWRAAGHSWPDAPGRGADGTGQARRAPDAHAGRGPPGRLLGRAPRPAGWRAGQGPGSGQVQGRCAARGAGSADRRHVDDRVERSVSSDGITERWRRCRSHRGARTACRAGRG